MCRCECFYYYYYCLSLFFIVIVIIIIIVYHWNFSLKSGSSGWVPAGVAVCRDRGRKSNQTASMARGENGTSSSQRRQPVASVFGAPQSASSQHTHRWIQRRVRGSLSRWHHLSWREDRIHFGRILEELWVVCRRIESIIWSIFTVKVINYRFRFLLSLWST